MIARHLLMVLVFAGMVVLALAGAFGDLARGRRPPLLRPAAAPA